MYEKGYKGRLKKQAVVGLLALSALTACSAHAKVSKNSLPAERSGGACYPLAVVLTQTLQNEIVATKKWPKSLDSMPHIGKILGIQLRSANGLLANSVHPSLSDAHTIVETFQTQFDSPTGVIVEVMPPTPALLKGELELTEFDQNCASVIHSSFPGKATLTT